MKNFTENNRCSGCGACCSDMLPLSDAEIQRIKKYIKDNGIKEQRHNAVTSLDATCPFRNEAERKCNIYPVRPAICRRFVCNEDESVSIRRRDEFHHKYKTVLMRNEFFGSIT